MVRPVGEALIKYLKHGRPKSAFRQVFLRSRAPFRPFSSTSPLNYVILARLKEAGIEVNGRHGPHAFRYARALSLLRASVPLKSISDLLGHTSTSSTRVYLKLETEDVRMISLEVPERILMRAWPDKDEALLNEYIRQLPPSTKQQAYRRVIRWFQIFVNHNPTFDQEAVQTWIRARSAQTCVQTALVNAQWIDRFLDWLVTRKAVAVNPFTELRRKYGCRLTAPIARALLSSSPTETLEALRPLPRYGSHLGAAMCDHVAHAHARLPIQP